ncbi:MAG TPA: response regulator transcription factor [Kofleriaceae bacterium]|nr:response regulator transcription factor [Kofleriaceae bacterium]
MPLLLVEDNVVLGNSLTRGLTEDGFAVDAVSTGAAALRSLERRDIDGVVLDLGLPDMDGLAVLDSARARGIHAPILVLTARDDVKSRVGALDRGADDYLVKPFEYDELLARLRALLRRAAAPRWAPRSCNGLVLRDDELAVTIDDQRIALSPREHALLGFFLRRQGEALGRAEILLQVFGYGFEPGTNLVNVHIANLRRKLGTHAVVIETVRGIGYRLRAAELQDG